VFYPRPHPDFLPQEKEQQAHVSGFAADVLQIQPPAAYPGGLMRNHEPFNGLDSFFFQALNGNKSNRTRP
jgi:hypothetical protein